LNGAEVVCLTGDLLGDDADLLERDVVGVLRRRS